MNKSDSIKELASALAKAQAKIEGANKDKTNPAFRSKYADLGSCWDACRDALSGAGLAVVQFPKTADGGTAVVLETVLMHASGEWISDEFRVPVSKQDAQGFGSAITYARRYALCAVVGIAPEDDDGNGAVGRKQESRPEPLPMMPPGELADHMTAINDANTPDALKHSYAVAVRSARSHGDAKAEARFTTAKDSRKIVLSTEPLEA